MADITKGELARLINSFLDGSCGKWDWDDFTSVRQHDPEIEKLRLRLINMRDEYPPSNPTEYCSEEGRRVMAAIAESLLHP
jgi:hypothetical protein